jgi:hypothetical protein
MIRKISRWHRDQLGAERMLGLAAAARGQEHRDEAERMKEVAPEDSQASIRLTHLRNHRKSLLPPFLDEFLHHGVPGVRRRGEHV